MENFDKILVEIGEIGQYQLNLILLLCFPVTFALPFTFMGQLFQTLTPDHWCHVVELENATSLTEEQKKLLSIPKVIHDGIPQYSQCLRFDRNYSQLLIVAEQYNTTNLMNLANATSHKTVKCELGWDYDTNHIRATATSDFDWVCDNNLKGYIALAFFFAGSATGCLIYGFISDRYGRLPTLLLVNTVAFLSTLATTFTQGFASFVVIRFIAGTTFDMSHAAFFILVLEYVGPTYRNRVSNLTFGLSFSLGSVVLPWVAYFTPNWRYFCIASAIPFILIVPFFKIIPESARWLISQNRIDDAIVILRKISKKNGKEHKESFWNSLKESQLQKNGNTNKVTKYSFLDLFRKRRLRTRFILTSLAWFLIMLSYDALVRNTENLGWNIYLSSTLGNATELPAALIPIFFLDKIGRRLCALVSFLIGTLFCLAILGVPTDNVTAFVTLATLARLMATVLMNIFLLYKAELFPTVLRGQAMSLAHLVGFIGSMTSPFIVYLGHVHKHLPMLILGGVMALGMILTCFLPETLYETIPDSFDDGEAFGKCQPFMYYPKPKTSMTSDVTTMPTIALDSFVNSSANNNLTQADIITNSEMHTESSKL